MVSSAIGYLRYQLGYMALRCWGNKPERHHLIFQQTCGCATFQPCWGLLGTHTVNDCSRQHSWKTRIFKVQKHRDNLSGCYTSCPRAQGKVRDRENTIKKSPSYKACNVQCQAKYCQVQNQNGFYSEILGVGRMLDLSPKGHF